MEKIWPLHSLELKNPEGGQALSDVKLVWQGLHICAAGTNKENGDQWLVDLPVAQAFITPMAYNITRDQLFPKDTPRGNWYAKILTDIIQNPSDEPVEFEIEGKSNYKKAIILNTIDAWYGHSLLSLFNVEKLIKSKEEGTALIVIIQPFLKWLIPKEGIDEIWVANIPLKRGVSYFSSLNNRIIHELQRFDEVYLSNPPVQPQVIEINRFTGVKPYCFNHPPARPRITFIWREDASRIWSRSWFLTGVLKYFKAEKLFLPVQFFRVKNLFKRLERLLGHQYSFTVAGMGKFGKFNGNIEDKRVNTFTPEVEREVCRIYAESVLVVGIHGSSLILPSGHAGMTISIMPKRRWGNFGQDVLYNSNKQFQEEVFDKRILPIEVGNDELANIIEHMINFRDGFRLRFIEHNAQL